MLRQLTPRQFATVLVALSASAAASTAQPVPPIVDYSDTAYVAIQCSDYCTEPPPAPQPSGSQWPGDATGPLAPMGGTPATFAYSYGVCGASSTVNVATATGQPTSSWSGAYFARTTASATVGPFGERDRGSAEFRHFGTRLQGESWISAIGAARAGDFGSAGAAVPTPPGGVGVSAGPSQAAVFSLKRALFTGGENVLTSFGDASAILTVNIFSPVDPANRQPADVNADGNVDQFDIIITQDGASQSYDPVLDITNDGVVNSQDVDSIITNRLATAHGDLNLDRKVNLTDFSLLTANFNAAGLWSTGDLNRDGFVSLTDFSILSANFGFGGAAPVPDSATAVPEPGCLLLGVASVGLLIRRR